MSLKGLSREFLAYFATFLQNFSAELALDKLMDFLKYRKQEAEKVWDRLEIKLKFYKAKLA